MDSTTSLSEDPPELLKKKIVSRFWRQPGEAVILEHYDTYFEYYNTTCHALFVGFSSKEINTLSINSHEDLLHMVDVFWELCKDTPNFDRPQARSALKKCLKHRNEPQDKINNSIDVLLRLWLTIRVQNSDFSPAAKTLQWDDTSTVQDFLTQHFPSPRSHSSDPGLPLESNFTAVNLYRMCGIRVSWTYQLEDHLKYDIENRIVCVYSLSQCLLDHLESVSILPRPLVEETLLSLSILFPNWNFATEKFLRKSQKLHLHDNLFEYPGHAHLDQFHHWRGRLSRLQLEFQAPGPGVRHIWSDRRNRLQWYTFWFAVVILILTIFFGVITTILTTLQTIYTYQSLQLAKQAASPGNGHSI